MTKTMNSAVVFAILLGGILLSSGLFVSDAYGAVFAKYDGVDGESADADHDKWIDVLSIDWGVDTKHKKKKNKAIAGEFVITMEYEKSSPVILEAITKGSTIPTLVLELTKVGNKLECPSEIPPRECPVELGPVTYLKYELKNVQITSYDVNASGNDESGPPTVTIGNNFEEMKVTYTEYDSEGNKGGNAETTWKVEKGEK